MESQAHHGAQPSSTLTWNTAICLHTSTHTRNIPDIWFWLARWPVVFTSLHGMQMRSSDESPSVRPSVCLSNAWIVTKQKKNQSRFLPRCMQCRRGLAMRFLSVRPSVRPSVCQTRVLWQNGRKICPDFYTMRKIILSTFMRRRMVGGGRPLLPEILG